MCTRPAERLSRADAGDRADQQASVGREITGAYRTPWGTGKVVVRQGNLVGVGLPGGGEPGNGATSSGRRLAREDANALERWTRELEEYFRGERLGWAVDEVALGHLGLGAFEHAVYMTLLSIPPAVTVSYGVLAEMAGYPRAARAVGNAMAANPIPVIIPCHRVIRADGSLGHYGDDPAWKERLLSHERANVSAGRAAEGAA